MMDFKALSPILIALVRSGVTRESVPACAPMPAHPEAWKGIMQLAEGHELGPLVRAGVHASGAIPPAEIAGSLERQARASEFNVGRALDQLETTVAALNAEGIEPLVIKGAYLAAAIYPSPGLRPFGDLDIIVPRERREDAAAVLAALGCHAQRYPGRDYSWWDEKHNHWIFVPQRGVPVELHWALSRPGTAVQFDIAALFRRSRPFALGASRARALEAEDCLIYLAAHAARHLFQVPLRSYVDLAALLQSAPEMDWEVVRRRSEDLHAQLDVTAFLGLIMELGLTSLPDTVAHWVQDVAGAQVEFPALALFTLRWPFVERPGTFVELARSRSMRQGRLTLQVIRRIVLPNQGRRADPRPSAGEGGAPSARRWTHHFGRLGEAARRLMEERAHIRSEIKINRLFWDRGILEDDSFD